MGRVARLAVIGAVVVLTAVVAVVAVAHTSHGPHPTPSPFPASGFITTPGTADPTCNSGHGINVHVRAPLPSNGIYELTSVTSAGGTTYVAISGLGSTGQATWVWAFTPECAPLPTFGVDGVAQFPGAPTSVGGFNVLGFADNGDIFVGTSNTLGLSGHIMLGLMTPRGTMDAHFGASGWDTLPWPGEISAVDQEPSGRILVANSDSGGSWGNNWVAALSATGRVDLSFGRKGVVAVPRYDDDVGIQRLAAEPDGTIVALTTGGNMGQWESYPTVISPSGSVDTRFFQTYDRAFRRLDPSSVLDADLFTVGEDVDLVGTQQAHAVDATPNARPMGRWYPFAPDGSPTSAFGGLGYATFAAPFAEGVTVVPRRDGGVFLFGYPPGVAPNVRQTFWLTALDGSGRLDQSYGTDGVATVTLPYLAGGFPTVTATSSTRDVVVVASDITTVGGDNFDLSEFRIP